MCLFPQLAGLTHRRGALFRIIPGIISLLQTSYCRILPRLLPNLFATCVPPTPTLPVWPLHWAVSHDRPPAGVWLLDSEERHGEIVGRVAVVEQGGGGWHQCVGIWIKKGRWRGRRVLSISMPRLCGLRKAGAGGHCSCPILKLSYSFPGYS